MTTPAQQVLEALASVKCYMYDSMPLPEDVCEEIENAIPAAQKLVDMEWQPIETAPKDGTRVLVKFKDNLSQYEGLEPGSLDRWCGLPFVGRHRGDIMEWAFAAPVGHGGFPDAWLEGWTPLPQPPKQEIKE